MNQAGESGEHEKVNRYVLEGRKSSMKRNIYEPYVLAARCEIAHGCFMHQRLAKCPDLNGNATYRAISSKHNHPLLGHYSIWSITLSDEEQLRSKHYFHDRI